MNHTSENISWILYTSYNWRLVPKIFPDFNVVAHLVVPAGWGSCLPRLAILLYCNKYFIQKYVCVFEKWAKTIMHTTLLCKRGKNPFLFPLAHYDICTVCLTVLKWFKYHLLIGNNILLLFYYITVHVEALVMWSSVLTHSSDLWHHSL